MLIEAKAFKGVVVRDVFQRLFSLYIGPWQLLLANIELTELVTSDSLPLIYIQLRIRAFRQGDLTRLTAILSLASAYRKNTKS